MVPIERRAAQRRTELAAIIPWDDRALVNCYEEAFRACVDQHDVGKVQDMLRIERQLALRVKDHLVDRAKQDKCLRFELVFDSRMEQSASLGTDYEHVRARVPLIRKRRLGFEPEASFCHL